MSIKNNKPFVLKNVEVRWARLHEPDTKFTPVYSVDAILSQDHIKQLEEQGVGSLIKEKDGDFVIKFKKKAFTKTGKAMQPPRVFDKNKEPFEGEVGNGSICNIAYIIDEYNFANRKGKTVRLVAVQVVKLVEYGGSASYFDEQDGSEEGDETDGNPFAD